MTILICSGSLFSDWETTHEQHLLVDSQHHEIYRELSALNENMCREYSPGIDKLGWKPFSPDESYTDKARHLLTSVPNEPWLAWADTNSSLILDFWQSVSDDARFMLFYDSPEYELSRFIKMHSYTPSAIRDVIEAWTIHTRAMLTFFMNNRDKCLLIDIQSAMRSPDKLIDKVNEVFDTELHGTGNKDYETHEESVLHEYFAATLLADNDVVSELFDEVRSAATLLDNKDHALKDIQSRTELLIPVFLEKIDQQERLQNNLKQTSEELSTLDLQLHQTQKELEFYYLKERDTASLNDKYVEFLNKNPLLKLARLARLNESGE